MRHVMGAVCWSYALVLLLAMVVAAPGGAQPSQNDLGTIPPGPEEIENSRPFMPPPRGLGEKAGVLELAGAGTTVENPDGTFTYTELVDGSSGPPQYTPPSNGGGFNIYSWYNQDYGWMHTFPDFATPNLQILSATMTVTAWDVDSEPSHGWDGEYDLISIDGAPLDPGMLQGFNGTWSVTVFNVPANRITDDGNMHVWLDIDTHHNEDWWATTLSSSVLTIHYTISPNDPPHRPVLAITPTGAVKDTDDLVVTVTGPNPPDPNEGDTVTYSYRWLVDVGQGIFVDDEFAGRGNHTGNTVPAADTVYGDIWRVEVTPTDNHGAVGPPAVATWRQVGADDPRIDLVSVRYTAPWRGSGRTRTMDYPRRGDRLVFYVAYTRLPSATSPVKVTRVRFTLTNGGYTQQFDGASGSQWSGTWTVPSNAPAGVYTLSCRLDWARTDGTGLTGSDTQFTGVGFPGPSTKQFTLYTAEMKLELVGNIAIDATNSYSENATVRVTAVDPSSGATLTGFSGKVYLAEDGTGIYSQNGGVLPASVDLLGGTTEFVAKSLSEAKVAFRTPPDPAKVKSTNFPVYRPWGPLSPSSLSIAQWVTSGGRVRWCQEWSDALLTAMKGAGGEVGELANKVSEVRVDDWTSNRYGYTTTGSTVVHVNPAAPRHRTNASHELSDTILHESRHIFQAWECEQSPAGAVNNDAGGLNLIDDPNNDDDPGLFSDGDWLPEIVTYASEMNPNGLRDGIDTGTGDGSPDSWSIVVSPAWEGDATEYGQAHRWGF